jgi:hypothetical protein
MFTVHGKHMREFIRSSQEVKKPCHDVEEPHMQKAIGAEIGRHSQIPDQLQETYRPIPIDVEDCEKRFHRIYRVYWIPLLSGHSGLDGRIFCGEPFDEGLRELFQGLSTLLTYFPHEVVEGVFVKSVLVQADVLVEVPGGVYIGMVAANASNVHPIDELIRIEGPLLARAK